MEVPDDAEGKQTSCPTCGHTFVIASAAGQATVQAKPAEAPSQPPPSQPAAPQAAPPQPHAEQSSPAQPPQPTVAQPVSQGRGPWRRRSIKELGVWRYAALIGATLALVSFFTVWWSATMGARYHDLADTVRQAKEFEASLPPENQRTWQHQQQAMQIQQRLQQQAGAFQQALQADQQKAENQLKGVDEFTEGVLDEDEIGREFERKSKADLKRANPNGAVVVQHSAYGWDFTRGILVFVLSIVAVGLLSAVMYVPAVRPFGWAATLPAAALGITSAILALTFLIGAPGENFTGEVVTTSMTVREGGWLALAGSVILAVFAAIDGVASLVSKAGQSKT
jgi:hypothetical protein